MVKSFASPQISLNKIGGCYFSGGAGGTCTKDYNILGYKLWLPIERNYHITCLNIVTWFRGLEASSVEG